MNVMVAVELHLPGPLVGAPPITMQQKILSFTTRKEAEAYRDRIHSWHPTAVVHLVNVMPSFVTGKVIAK